MASTKSGVATQLKLLNGKFRNLKDLKEMFSTPYEIYKLVQKSPKRNTRLDQIRSSTKNVSKGIHTLFPARWTVRGDALAAFIDNYIELMDLCGWSLQDTSETVMKARLQSVKAVMSTFQFLFSCSLGKIILKQTDNLSKTLQSPSISSVQGQKIANLVTKMLSKVRCDEKFEFFGLI